MFEALFSQNTFKELDARNADNPGEGRWIVSLEPTRFSYAPSYREFLLEQLNCYAEDEIHCRRFGHEFYPSGTRFSLIHDTESGEDYWFSEFPGEALEEHQQRRFGPCASMIELFDGIVDMDMQPAE